MDCRFLLKGSEGDGFQRKRRSSRISMQVNLLGIKRCRLLVIVVLHVVRLLEVLSSRRGRVSWLQHLSIISVSWVFISMSLMATACMPLRTPHIHIHIRSFLFAVVLLLGNLEVVIAERFFGVSLCRAVCWTTRY